MTGDLVLTIVVAVLFYLAATITSKRKKKTNINDGHSGAGVLPPGPKSLPILGNLLELGELPHQSLARLAKIHGGVMTIQLGAVTSVVVSTPAAAREALQKRDHALSDRWVPDSANSAGSNASFSILWNSPGPLWKQLRAITITQLNSSRSLDDTAVIRHRKVAELQDYLRRNAGKPVEVCRVVFCTVLNMVSNVLFSFDMADLEAEEPSDFQSAVRGIAEESGRPNISDFFPVLRPLDLQQRRRKVGYHAQKLYDHFEKIIADREKLRNGKLPDEGAGDFLDFLLRLQAQQGSMIDRRIMKALLVDLFTAATDTSTTTIEWIMAELVRHQDVLAKVRAEIIAAVGDDDSRAVEESDISKFPTLNAVMKETMRMHPPGPLLVPHKASLPSELGGYSVPEGTRVFINVWAIGRDPDVWGDPEKFRPERFMEKDIDLRGKDFELLPFGSGRRSCPGMPMALRVVPLILASLLRSFHWRLPDGVKPEDVDLSEKLGVVLAMAVPLLAVPELTSAA